MRTDDPKRPRLRLGPNRARITEVPGVRAGVWLLLLAIALLCIALVPVARLLRGGDTDEAAHVAHDRGAGATGDASAERAVSTPLHPRAVIRVAPPRQMSDDEAIQPRPPAVVPHRAASGSGAEPAPTGESPMVWGAAPEEGSAASPAAGSQPIKRGIIVPDDYEVPPGYERHYQTTADGQQLPPILMFQPDYHPVDEQGFPILLPDDRIVPLELAPSGMPIQMLDLPEDKTAP